MMTFDLVRQFQDKMGLNCPDEFTPMTSDVIQRRVNLIVEEVTETTESLGILHHDKSPQAHAHCMKELCDLIFVAVGTAVEMGLDITPFFEEVSRSNLTKVGGELNESGKLMKPPGYSKADMKKVFYEQVNI